MNNMKINNWIKSTVSLVLLVYLFQILDWQKVKELDIYAIVVLCISISITLFLLIFMSLRWKLLVQMQTNQTFSVKMAYRIYLMGMFFNIFMPGAIGGDMARIKYSSDHCRLSMKKAGLVVGIERLFGLTALFILFAIGAILNFKMLPILEINSYLWGIPVIFVVIIFAKYWISKHIKIRFSMYLPILSLSAIGQLTDIIIVYLFCRYFSLNVSFGNLLIIMPLVYIATVLPISIGGLGVREGAMVGLFSLFSVDVSIVVIISFMMYLSKVGVGLIGLPFFLKIDKPQKLDINLNGIDL